MLDYCLQPLHLSEIAIGLGYFDQAHFVREFRQLSPMSPSEVRGLAAIRP